MDSSIDGLVAWTTPALLASRSGDEWLVGVVALALGVIGLAVAAGPWVGPYRLRTVARLQHRFGRSAGRLFWATLGLVGLILGLLILSGLRPAYATSHRWGDGNEWSPRAIGTSLAAV